MTFSEAVHSKINNATKRLVEIWQVFRVPYYLPPVYLFVRKLYHTSYVRKQFEDRTWQPI